MPEVLCGPNPSGMCLCGCGQKTKLASMTGVFGSVKGQPNQYLHGHRHKSYVPDYVVDTVSGCWVWQKGTSAGYGMMRHNGIKTQAHRVYYERLVGPIPKGRVLHHLCVNRQCINPAHLSPINRREHRIQHGLPCKSPPYGV